MGDDIGWNPLQVRPQTTLVLEARAEATVGKSGAELGHDAPGDVA